MKRHLFIKIFTTYFVLILLVVALLDFLLIPQIREVLTKGIEDKMIGHGQIMTHMTEEQIRRNMESLADEAGARLTFIGAAGNVTADSRAEEKDMDNHLNRPEIQEARLKGRGSSVRYSRTLQENMLYVALPVKADDRITGYIRLARPLNEVRESIEKTYRYIYLTLFIIAVPSLILAFIFSRTITAPIRRITEFARKMREGQLPKALIMDSRDEIGQLANDMNHILQEQQEKTLLAMEEKSKLEAAFAAMVEGILILGSDNRIEACNPSLKRMIGRADQDFLGKTLLEAFHNAALQDALQRFRESGDVPVAEEIVMEAELSVVANVSISPIQNLPGKEKKIIMVFHDMTRLKKLERMRADFIVNLTHELKTPLTAIIGYAETLQDMKVNNAALHDRFLGIIREHAGRLSRLVDDLLILSNLEQGDILLEMMPVSPRKIMENILPIIQSKADGKGLAVRLDLPDTLPLINGDRDKVAQVFLNVLDNAVKFTSSGQIAVKAFIRPDDPHYLSVQVADTGQGIPKAEIPRLGERFYRVDRARSRDLGGTGLGLSIVKHIMKAHDGTMDIESIVGKGTTITLHFPIIGRDT